MELSLFSVWTCSVELHPLLVGNASSFPFIKCRSFQFRILVQKCAVNPEIPIKKIGGSDVRKVGTSHFEDGAARRRHEQKHSLLAGSSINCSEKQLEVTAGGDSWSCLQTKNCWSHHSESRPCLHQQPFCLARTNWPILVRRHQR